MFTRRDAVRCGYTERELKTATGHHGGWVVVRRGCYAERDRWTRLDEDTRYLLRVRVAVLVQWEEMFGERRRRTMQRLAAEYAQTVARYGTAAG